MNRTTQLGLPVRSIRSQRSRSFPLVPARSSAAVVTLALSLLCPITALAQTKSQEAAATVQFQPTPPPATASQVSFTGNHTFDSKQLRAALADPLLSIQRQGLSLPLADDTAYYLEVFYRRQGFPNVNVTYRVNGSSLELNITEGHRYGLGTIHFEGNHSFPDKSLQDYMIGTTRARGTQFQKQLPFVQADLETGAGLLKNYYVSQGFPNVQIAPLQYRYDDVRSLVDVVVPITEGEKFVFGSVTFSGVPERAIRGLKSKINSLTHPPKPFSQSALVNLQHDLIFELKHYGYATAQVNVDADINTARNGVVPFKVSVEAGPVYRFGRIIVQQQPKTRVKPDFLPNRFAQLTGRIYDPIRLQQLDTEMITTGLYDSLDIQETAEPDDTLQLTLTPIEAKQKYFTIFGGYDTFYGIIFGGSFSDRNFTGEGQIVSAAAEITSRGPKGKISYEDPWFLNTKLDFLAEVGIEDQNLYGYTYVDEYAHLSLTAKYGNTLTTGSKEYQSGVFLLFRNANVSQITITPETLVGPTGYELVTLGLTQTIDKRDNPLNPRKGWIVELAASDTELLRNYINYITLTERFSVYVPVGPTVLAAGVRFGAIIPSEGGFLAIPIEERLFNGGANSVRSFLERELGPKDVGNNPIGGLEHSIFNIEDDFPIFAGIIGAVFFDSGGLGNSPFDHFSTGVGLGLRYNLPVGPIRVDYGINPAPAHGDSFGAFNLSFGFAF
jgi:outer membrane protein insertion porin family